MHDGLLASDPATATGDGDWLTRQHALALLLLAGTALAFLTARDR